MRSKNPTRAEMERAIAAAYTFFREQDGMTPHAIIDDLIGLEMYRRMMHCPDMETLASYAEDTLPFENALQIAAHERRCPVCRADAEDFRSHVRQEVTQLFAAMPAWTTPFVGRDALRETLGETLGSGSAPVVTLAAPSGMGKTRLLLETAVEQSYLFPDGVWYVGEMQHRNSDQAAGEIARAVQLPLQSKNAPVEQLREFFADKRALLVLDDVAAHTPAAQVVGTLSRNAPDLCCLTTAPGALGLAGERAVALPPLQLPEMRSSTEMQFASEGVQLFTAHVGVMEPGYLPEESDVRAIAAICERTAGIPLAIELAAARMREMPPQEILRRLNADGMNGNMPPDTSLREFIAWAFGLLGRRDQEFLARVSVFAGGFFTRQAADVCEAEDAAARIGVLYDHAIVQASEAAGRTRFQLLHPIRDFARQQLKNPAFVTEEQAISTEKRHMAHFLQFTQTGNEKLQGREQVEACEDLTIDLPNIRAGMDWAQQAGEWRSAGQYGLALRRFLTLHGDWHECAERLRQSIDCFARGGYVASQEQAKLELGRCLTSKGDYDEAETMLAAVAAFARGSGDTQLLAEAASGLGNVAQFRGRYAEAVAQFTAAQAQFAALGDTGSFANCQHNLGWLAWRQGDYDAAERLLRESLVVQRERGDRYYIGTTLAVLGNIAYEQGRLDEARMLFAECLQARQELGDARGIASAITNQGMVWQSLGDPVRAEFCYADAARRFERLGVRRDWGQVLAMQGELALRQNDLLRARLLAEQSLRLLETAGDVHRMAESLALLGRVAQQEGSLNEAGQHYRASLSRFQQVGDTANVGVLLYRCGELAAEQGDTERAALLLAVALRICTERRRQECDAVAEVLNRTLESQNNEQANALRERAASLTTEQAAAFAMHPEQ